MRAHPPESSHADEEGGTEHLSGTGETSFKDKKNLRLINLYEKNQTEKDFKNTEIHLVLLRPLFSAVILDEENTDYSLKPRLTRSLCFSCGTCLPEDGSRGQTSETYFYQSEERSSNLLVFLFSHIAFIFLKCAYCTLDSGYV